MSSGEKAVSLTWRPQCLGEGVAVWASLVNIMWQEVNDLSWQFHRFQKVLSESNFEALFTVDQRLTDDPLSHDAPWVAAWTLSNESARSASTNWAGNASDERQKHNTRAVVFDKWICEASIFAQNEACERHADPARKESSRLIRQGPCSVQGEQPLRSTGAASSS